MNNNKSCSTQIWLLLTAMMISPLVSAEDDEATAPRLVTLEDMGAVMSPNSPHMSPDGREITYLFDGQVFAVSSDGSESRAITSSAAPAREFRWSADGEAIYFLSDRGDASQLYKLPMNDPGEAIQVTHFTHRVSSMNLSPDESRVLLAISDNRLLEVADDAEPQPIVVTRRGFKRDAGNGYIVDGDSRHLYVYDIDSRQIKQLTTGRFEEEAAAWSPDGKSIVFVSNREDEPDAGYRTDLWVVVDDGAEDEPALRRLTDNSNSKRRPTYSPSGDQIAYITSIDGPYGLGILTVMPADGGEAKALSASLDRSIGNFQYSDDGDWIYFTYQDSGAVNLARVRVRDARIEKLIEGDQVVGSFDVSESGDIVVTANKQNDSANIYRLDRDKLTQLTDLNRTFFDNVKLGNKTKVRIEGADGTLIDTFITTPPGYEPGQAYPTILNTHGGPQAQFSWGYGFSTQFFASKGYVVVEPNPRGSTGRGQEFLASIYRAWGITDYEDVIAAVDYAIAEGISDPDQLAATGYSYGGYMTNVIISRTTRFKAAASGAGSSHVEGIFGHDLYTEWYLWELGVPWKNREKYDVHSPVLRAGDVTTPTLFLGGSDDWNMTIANAEMFYLTLKIQDIDTQLVVYPGMHHGGWPERFDKDYLTRIVDWFDLYTLGQE